VGRGLETSFVKAWFDEKLVMVFMHDEKLTVSQVSLMPDNTGWC